MLFPCSICKLFVSAKKLWINFEDYICRCEFCSRPCKKNSILFENILVKKYGGNTKEANIELEKLDFFLQQVMQ